MMNKGWIVGTVVAVLAVPSVGMARYTGRMPAGIAAGLSSVPAAAVDAGANARVLAAWHKHPAAATVKKHKAKVAAKPHKRARKHKKA